ncbi:MAG: flagellar basal body rod C-terminal domain-containing protein [Sphingomonas bacterium]
MSLNDILGSAISGLAAAQAGLRTVSNNIANVGVSGYARERVNLSTGVSSGQVSGVIVGEPTRVADRFLEATVYQRAGDYGRADVTNSYLDRLQGLLGQPGSNVGLSARLDAISASAVSMTGALGTEQTVAQFTANVADAIDSMRQLESDVTSLRTDVESEVGYTVDKINTLLQRINDLNATVAQQTGLGRSASGAADQRMSAIEELSGLIGIVAREQPDGRVSIETSSGAVLLDKRLRQLSYPTAGQGSAQPVYPTIEIRFADQGGALGASTGEKLDSAAVGGKLGGLLDLRDRMLPDFEDKIGMLFGGLSEALNSVSNAGSAVPPPAMLSGRQTGMLDGDRLGFTGAATFAVVASDGTMIAKTRVDFDALGPNATIADMVNAINAGLGGAGTAGFVDGRLTIKAAGTGNGVAIAQDADAPAARAGVGVSQFFGMNDLVVSDGGALVPSGFAAGDPHGFDTGQTTQFVLRDAGGRTLGSYTLQPQTGGTMGDLVDALNNGSLGAYGNFSLDDRGRLRFDPVGSLTGATLSVPSDSTSRYGLGASFSATMQITGGASGLGAAEVLPEMLANPARLPLAMLNDVAPGAKALGAGDTRGATAFVTRLSEAVDLGRAGVTTMDAYASKVLGNAGLQASQARSRLEDAGARRDDAINRRDNFSGVNIDEELAQMVVLQNSYSAAARVLTTAQDMYDALLGMVR